MDTGLEIHHKLNVTHLWINFFTTSIPAFSSFKDRMYSWVKSRNRGHFPKSCPRRRDSVNMVNLHQNWVFKRNQLKHNGIHIAVMLTSFKTRASLHTEVMFSPLIMTVFPISSFLYTHFEKSSVKWNKQLKNKKKTSRILIFVLHFSLNILILKYIFVWCFCFHS